MRSIPAALTWELFERGKWSFLGALLAGNALPVFMLAALLRDGAINPEDQSMIIIHVTALLINGTVFGAVLFTVMGNISRLRAFPVPTSVIVAWQLLPSMAIMALECLLSTAAINAIFKVNWPLWGPALFLPVALAACVAVFWLTEKSPWYLFILGIPVFAALGIWFFSRYPFNLNAPASRMWREVTAIEVVTMLAVAVISYYVAVVGVARTRCGEYLSTPEFFRWLGRLLNGLLGSTLDVDAPFRTPAQAQFWFEWRRKGWALPAIVIFALSIGFVGWLLFDRNPNQLFEKATAAGAVLPVLGLIVGLIFGNANTSDLGGVMEMGHFLATRPMTSTDLSRTMLKAAGISMVVAWAIWAAAYLALYAILLLANVAPRPLLAGDIGWWCFPLTLLGTWAALTFVATIALTGRQFLLLGLFVGIPALTIGITMISLFLLTPETRKTFSEGITTLVGMIFILGTVWAFLAARRRSLIGLPNVWAAAGAWVALCLLFGLFWWQHRIEHPASVHLFVHSVGLLALVVFPLAAAPLSLAWNRNR